MTKINGVYTALITPFKQDLTLDEKALRHLIQIQLQHHIDGIVVIGTTGEAPSLSDEEKIRIITIAHEEIQGKCALMVGTGGYNTHYVIKDTHTAADLGADIAIIVAPYYNRPSQEGLYRHFKAIAEETTIPIMLYNIPGRTGVNLQMDTLKRLMDIPQIVGIKDASGSLIQMSESIEAIQQKRQDFSIMSGDDIFTLPLMSLGGDGVISVISNLVPGEVKILVDAINEKDYTLARQMHYKLAPLCRAAFVETNPVPIKTALSMCGLSLNGCRLPLCELSQENLQFLKTAVEQYRDIAAPTFM